MSKIESLASTPCHPRFILLVSSSDTLFVVSTLRHSLRLPFAAVSSVLSGLIVVPMGNMSPFSLDDNPFKTEGALWRCSWTMSKIESLACARLAIRGLSCW